MRFDYLILAGGKFPPVSFLKRVHKLCDQVVVVDRGLDLAQSAGIPWNIFIGDQDSVKGSVKLKSQRNRSVFILSKRKSVSDLEWAIKKLLTGKQKSALILASHQDHEGRADHLFANLLLAMKKPGQVILADEEMWIIGLKNQKFSFKTMGAVSFSFISPQRFELSISGGVQYPVSKTKILSPTHALSNCTKPGKKVQVEVKGSALLFVGHGLK